MTNFDEVIDLALVVVDDYRLKKLWNQNEKEFKTYVDGFLLSAIPFFKECRQSLIYNLCDRVFEADLTASEKSILANLWVIQWYAKDNQNYAMYRQHLQNSSSFKNHSESQNLKENSIYADKLREEVNRQIVAYQMEDLSTYLG
mgnify:CR=1 FL=1